MASEALLRSFGCRTRRMLATAFFVKPVDEIKYPQLRGKIHLLLVYLSPLWITCFYSHAQSTISIVAVSIASFSFLMNFGASALLHNFAWSDPARCKIRRLDYAGIFVMIAGCCAPAHLLLLDFWWCVAVVAVQWTAAAIGVAASLSGRLSLTGYKVYRSAIYVFVGLSNAVFARQFVRATTRFECVCLIGLASFYVLGAVIYAARRPDPSPKKFGFHEVFHTCCLLSAVCTFCLNMSILERHQYIERQAVPESILSPLTLA